MAMMWVLHSKGSWSFQSNGEKQREKFSPATVRQMRNPVGMSNCPSKPAGWYYTTQIAKGIASVIEIPFQWYSSPLLSPSGNGMHTPFWFNTYRMMFFYRHYSAVRGISK